MSGGRYFDLQRQEEGEEGIGVERFTKLVDGQKY